MANTHPVSHNLPAPDHNRNVIGLPFSSRTLPGILKRAADETGFSADGVAPPSKKLCVIREMMDWLCRHWTQLYLPPSPRPPTISFPLLGITS
jgi:hypothetical protein